MKKNFSLDYSIEKDTDRLKAIETILDDLPENPSNADLELMANYILDGKGDDGKNASMRGDINTPTRRYSSFKKRCDKNESLDAIMETTNHPIFKPLTEKRIYPVPKPRIKHPKYDAAGNLIDAGDSDVPGMQELWSTIARLDEYIQTLPDGSYKKYKLRHDLIEMRRQQYILRDSYKPTIKPMNAPHPEPQHIDWTSDSAYWVSEEELRRKPTFTNLADYESRPAADGTTEYKWVVRRHIFDWENPKHIRCLIRFYSDIVMESWEDQLTWEKTLVYDFDRYVDKIELTPLQEELLTLRIDKLTFMQIAKKMEEDHGIKMSDTAIYNIVAVEIPNMIARMAHNERTKEEPTDRKTCQECHRSLPATTFFFGKNSGKRDGLTTICRDCDRKKRSEKKWHKKKDNA